MPLGCHQPPASSTAPPASNAQRNLLPLAHLASSYGSLNCNRSTWRNSLVLDGLLGQHTSRVAAACSANGITAVPTQVRNGADFVSIFAARGRQSGAASSSGRPLATSWTSSERTGATWGRLPATARSAWSHTTAGFRAHNDTTSANSSSAGNIVNGLVSVSSSSVDHSTGTGLGAAIGCSSRCSRSGTAASVVARRSIGTVCRSRGGVSAGGGGVLATGCWNRRSRSVGSSSRCFSTGSGGPIGGGGGFSSDDGSGLPPPVIISPVALRVVVIGWMGSNRRYLNKYGALWARSGDHEVLLIRPTVTQTLVRWRGVVVAGRDIDRVARMHRENPAMPTIYHVFSTGGFIHAGTMWRWMDEVEDVAQRRDLLEEVRGIILDSAPAAVNPEMSARAIVSAFTNTPAEELSYGMSGVQGGLLEGTRTFMERYLRSKGVKMRTEEVYDAWYNLAPVCPQLYLYSDADPLVPASDVEKYMGVQEGRGVEVSGYKWPDSGHVEHFRRHPHEYAYQISTFLARVLRDW